MSHLTAILTPQETASFLQVSVLRELFDVVLTCKLFRGRTLISTLGISTQSSRFLPNFRHMAVMKRNVHKPYHVFRKLSFCLQLWLSKFASTFHYIDLLKPSGFLTYHEAIYLKILHGARFALNVFLRMSEQTAAFAVYDIKGLVFITVMESVYSAVRTDSLYRGDYVSTLKG